jgi:hypothetical protein
MDYQDSDVAVSRACYCLFLYDTPRMSLSFGGSANNVSDAYVVSADTCGLRPRTSPPSVVFFHRPPQSAFDVYNHRALYRPTKFDIRKNCCVSGGNRAQQSRWCGVLPGNMVVNDDYAKYYWQVHDREGQSTSTPTLATSSIH